MATRYPLATTAIAITLAGVALAILVVVLAWPVDPTVPAGNISVSSADIGGVAFNTEPISPLPQRIVGDAEKVALGNKLFHDTRLSRDNTIACATCHKLNAAGIDGRRSAVGIGGQVGTVNTPTVFNSGFNFRQFWDGRAADLEEQAAGPVHNPAEMGSDWPEVLGKLGQDPAYRTAFGRLYADGLSGANIQDAIASFERTLITPDSRFDRYLRGEKAALGERELHGYRLFKELGCASCHQGTGIGGNFYAGLGIFGNFFADRGKDAAEDQGRFNATGKEGDRHRFKVPSLRNVARTGPYFHDGSVETLQEAIRIMGKYQLGRALADDEIELIAAFLASLTGNYQGHPL